MVNADELNSSTLPYEDTVQMVSGVISAILGSIGIVISLLVITTLLFHKQSSKPYYYLVFSICFSNLIVCMSMGTTSIFNLVNGGWSLGRFACSIDYIITQGAACASVFTHLVVALERYDHVVRSQALSWSSAKIRVLCVWMFSLALSLYPLVNIRSIFVAPSYLTCILDYSIQGPAGAEAILGVIILFSSFAWIFTVYYGIYHKARIVVSEGNNAIVRPNIRSSEQNSKGKSAAASRVDREQILRSVYIKGLIHVGVFVLFWFPFTAVSLYALIVKIQPGPLYSALGLLFALLYCVFCPILLVLLDQRIKRAVSEYYRITIPDLKILQWIHKSRQSS